MKKLAYVLLLIAIATACGDPGVDVGETQYEPKIVVEGYVYPGRTPADIKLMRNFKLEVPIDSALVFLTPVTNSVNAKIMHEGETYPLSFDPQTLSWYNNDLVVQSLEDYRIEVTAVIDGKELFAASTTTVPATGFNILIDNLGEFEYDSEIVASFRTSPGTAAYAFSILADVATLDNFIYDNHYFPDIKREDLEDDGWNGYRFQNEILVNVNSYESEPIEYNINGLDTWFYSRYTVIGYAADENMKDFVLTAKHVQQSDGNFIEPEFHFEGDGIGVFGSAVTDTMYFTINQN